MNLAENKIKYKTHMTTIVYNHMIKSVFKLYLPSTILWLWKSSIYNIVLV